MEIARSPSAAGIILRLLLARGTHQPTSPIVFDDSIVASEVSIISDDGAVVRLPSTMPGTRRRLADGAAAIVLSTALRVDVRGVTFEGGEASHGVSAVVVEAGELTIENCTLRNISGARAALRATGGTVSISNCTFADNQGGAIEAASGSQMTVVGSELVRNGASANRGGGIHVSGNATMLTVGGTSFESNSAIDSGGGLYVAGGTVVLANRTLLHGNDAPVRPTMDLAGGETSYALPAPSGRWVNTAELDETLGTLVSALAQYGTHTQADYPFGCPPGSYGTDDDIDTQVSSVCKGACPAGKICAGATSQPQPCTEGAYCPMGSPGGTFCEPGTYGTLTNLTAQEECQDCPRGHYCQGGKYIPCPLNQYGPFTREFLPTACQACPRFAITAGTGTVSVDECECDTGYFNTKLAAGEVQCDLCPVGSLCVDTGTNLSTSAS